MITHPNQKQNQHAQGTFVDIDAMLAALDALGPGKQQQKTALFSKLYPGILDAMMRNVPQKLILAELQRFGLKLHPARFKEMLAAEHELRDESGKSICCEACGAVRRPRQESSNQKVPPDDGAQGNRTETPA